MRPPYPLNVGTAHESTPEIEERLMDVLTSLVAYLQPTVAVHPRHRVLSATHLYLPSFSADSMPYRGCVRLCLSYSKPRGVEESRRLCRRATSCDACVAVARTTRLLLLGTGPHVEPRKHCADVLRSFRVYQGHTGQRSPGPNWSREGINRG